MAIMPTRRPTPPPRGGACGPSPRNSAAMAVSPAMASRLTPAECSGPNRNEIPSRIPAGCVSSTPRTRLPIRAPASSPAGRWSTSAGAVRVRALPGAPRGSAAPHPRFAAGGDQPGLVEQLEDGLAAAAALGDLVRFAPRELRILRLDHRLLGRVGVALALLAELQDVIGHAVSLSGARRV